jgi:hypothetical protein
MPKFRLRQVSLHLPGGTDEITGGGPVRVADLRSHIQTQNLPHRNKKDVC